jgi:4-hydroxy-2-oxoglutarate aldolase
MKKIKGIFPPIATPFLNDEIAIDKLKDNLSKWESAPLAGYVVMGSNGESVLLSRNEKLLLTETVKQNVSPEKIIIAGTGSDSIQETISLSNDCADRGADYALVLTPSFYKSEMKHKSFINYFKRVADKTKIPILIYNVPKFTGVDIELNTVEELSHHQNIAGIKNSTENIRQISEFVSSTHENFSVIVGTGSVLLPALVSGASGGILALANIAPNESAEIQKLYEEGKLKEATKIQNRMLPVNKAITARFGVAGLKYSLDLIGFYGGLPREPLLPLEQSGKDEIKKILLEGGLLNNLENRIRTTFV